ncbi:MAG: succinate dehydrogenase assembly factor 2 [Micavibrio aeruginosavorus]|nr:succinate dehydrogenase assembly factor 2 [Micavibrio aeruginosavorus]
MTETDMDKRKRLKFRSWHRGTRELDLIMGTFADRTLDGLTGAELDLYDQILTHPDPDLYNWITAVEPVPANFMNPVMEKLLRHRVAQD